jgi:hypothetical protein
MEIAAAKRVLRIFDEYIILVYNYTIQQIFKHFLGRGHHVFLL